MSNSAESGSLRNLLVNTELLESPGGSRLIGGWDHSQGESVALEMNM